ncbi:MAG: hypothetical protein AUJ37_02795 [Candidatus Magasanikbacteria bacterium CG1_02_41_34]|nr:MAG: hypothetical protein AUJ37_02795 [Candidatus Magasanikbacteria bacterium CG1_02_41_34]
MENLQYRIDSKIRYAKVHLDELKEKGVHTRDNFDRAHQESFSPPPMNTTPLNIKILGTGCPNCITLEHNTRQAVAELQLDAVIDKITDIESIMGYGVMSTPALVVNEEVQSAGRVSDVEEIKIMLTAKKQTEQPADTSSGDACGCSHAC